MLFIHNGSVPLTSWIQYDATWLQCCTADILGDGSYGQQTESMRASEYEHEAARRAKQLANDQFWSYRTSRYHRSV